VYIAKWTFETKVGILGTNVRSENAVDCKEERKVETGLVNE
jgi:hypothetical protein